MKALLRRLLTKINTLISLRGGVKHGNGTRCNFQGDNMKVLIVAPYIFNKEWPEFTKNRTGFGLMVNDIFESVSADADAYLLTQVITDGHDKVLRHTWADVFLNARWRDWLLGIKLFLAYKQSLKERCRYFYYGLNAGTLRKTIKKLRPDIVHIHGVGIGQKPFIDVCEEEHAQYIVTLHGLIGLDESVSAQAWDKAFERDFLINASEKEIPVTVISTGMKRRIEEHYLNQSAENITVICNGTKVAIQSADDVPDKYNIRKEFNIAENEKIAVAIGNLCERKNQMQIVRAFATQKIQAPCQIFFCGGDTMNGAVQRNIENNDLSGRIHWLGFLPPERVARLLDQADLNIVASRDEGFGLSIIEAFVHGVPTVTFSDLDAIPDLYDERAMLTVDSRDDVAFGGAIEAALEKKWDKEHIKAYSRHFSLNKMAEKYIAAYSECCGHE